MTDKELLAKARKEAGSIWRLWKAMDILLGKGPSYNSWMRAYRLRKVGSGLRSALALFLSQPEAFKRQIREADERKGIPYGAQKPHTKQPAPMD